MSKSRIHILGICGTFMAGVATLAKQSGIQVEGSDQGVYPPMSTLLESQGIHLKAGYTAENLLPQPELVVIGNALSRGNPAVEAVLNTKTPYTSGPEWLRNHILPHREVYAVAGTHGKTSTSGMLAWILEQAGQQPGFLIGGKPGNFDHSARLGEGPAFVVEADEYDTAFFDKRSKFVHYRPKVAILNNLEFDHADIFDDIEAIKTQFHHLVRTIPGNGCVIVNKDDANLAATLEKGCWSNIETFSIEDDQADWFATALNADASAFAITYNKQTIELNWPCFGDFNMSNALAAVAAAHAGGVDIKTACHALTSFKLPAKRLQAHDNNLGLHLYEDFAHHPTAIRKTLDTLKARYPDQKLIAVLEPRSNTMKMGVHRATLAAALTPADSVYFYSPTDVSEVINLNSSAFHVFSDMAKLQEQLQADLQTNDVIAIMSNGDFGGLARSLASMTTVLSNPLS